MQNLFSGKSIGEMNATVMLGNMPDVNFIRILPQQNDRNMSMGLSDVGIDECSKIGEKYDAIHFRVYEVIDASMFTYENVPLRKRIKYRVGTKPL